MGPSSLPSGYRREIRYAIQGRNISEFSLVTTTSCMCIQSPCAVADAGSARTAGKTANSTKEQAQEVFMGLMLKLTELTIPGLSALSCSVYVFFLINHCGGMT